MPHTLCRTTRRVGLLTVLALALAACSGKETFSPQVFAGKWKSSRLITPIYLHENGEWEIKTDSGALLQYGTWQYQNRQIIWRVKLGKTITQDNTTVLSATPTRFQLRESDQSVTSFDRLN